MGEDDNGLIRGLTGHLSSLNDGLEGALRRLREVNDKLYGAQPEETSSQGNGTAVQGAALQEHQSAINYYEGLLTQIHEEAERLERLVN
jgi:hypothetical protein